MTRSENIRHLLSQFPALKPKAIERILGEHGIPVDANMIGVTRLRHRRSRKAEEALFRVVARLIQRRPDLLPLVQASFDELVRQVAATAPAFEGRPEDDLVVALAAAIPRQSPPETASARASRIYMAVLDRHPEFRRSTEVALGLRAGSVLLVVPRFEGDIDRMTDAEIEESIIRYLEHNFPPGDTAEGVVRAVIARFQQGQHEYRNVRQERVESILAAVVKEVPVGSPADLLRFLEHFLEINADWSDEQITDWVVARAADREGGEPGTPTVDLNFEGLTIRKHK